MSISLLILYILNCLLSPSLFLSSSMYLLSLLLLVSDLFYVVIIGQVHASMIHTHCFPSCYDLAGFFRQQDPAVTQSINVFMSSLAMITSKYRSMCGFTALDAMNIILA